MSEEITSIQIAAACARRILELSDELPPMGGAARAVLESLVAASGEQADELSSVWVGKGYRFPFVLNEYLPLPSDDLTPVPGWIDLYPGGPGNVTSFEVGFEGATIGGCAPIVIEQREGFPNVAVWLSLREDDPTVVSLKPLVGEIREREDLLERIGARYDHDEEEKPWAEHEEDLRAELSLDELRDLAEMVDPTTGWYAVFPFDSVPYVVFLSEPGKAPSVPGSGQYLCGPFEEKSTATEYLTAGDPRQ